jgi:hypothetical protein
VSGKTSRRSGRKLRPANQRTKKGDAEMNDLLVVEAAREHRGELLRETERRLTRKLNEARKAHTEASEPVKRRIEIRWGSPEDEPRIVELLELNGMPRRAAFEEQFVVAEEDGEVLAALAYRTAPKRLLLGLLVADPWAGERELAVALYAGGRDLAQEMGVREIRARSAGRAGYPREAGYRRRAGEWRLDVAPPSGSRSGSPTAGWRRILVLWGVSVVPFFRAFRG